MAKDNTTVGIGLIYIVLIILQWVFLYLPYTWEGIHIYTTRYIVSSSGFLVFIGCWFLVPSFILNTIFFASTESTTPGKVGFGLGIPGWFFSFMGGLDGFSESVGLQPTWLCSFIFTLGLIVFGSLLMWRVYVAEDTLFPSRTTYATPSATPTTFSPPPGAARSIQPPGPPCPNCDRATRFIPEYNRYYCDSCQKYV
jgi:hypothetical protein